VRTPGQPPLGFLERSAPGRWALKSNVIRADQEQEQLEEPLPSEVLQRHRGLLLELAKEDA
jgi:hypothetical protein